MTLICTYAGNSWANQIDYKESQLQSTHDDRTDC